jgi:rhodanese-related sulfurtransferase
MTSADTLPRRLDVSTLREWLSGDAPAQVLDVRTAAEFEVGHVPGSVNIPLSQLPRVCQDLAGSGRSRIAVMCQSGVRSEKAKELLRENGCAAARVVDGGLNAWQAMGGEIEQGRPLWALERQVRLVAGSLVLLGVVGSKRYPKMKLLTGAIGGGLAFAAASNTCAMGNVLARLPYNQRSRRDVDDAVARLTSG